MSRDWSWFDAFREGDHDAFSRSLADETDRSLEKDPGRWSWRNTDEIEPRRPQGGQPGHANTRGGRGGHVADQRHRTGKGNVSQGASDERTAWAKEQWDAAKADYERQNPRSWWDGERDDDHDEGRGWFR